jgi:hypothetical protein
LLLKQEWLQVGNKYRPGWFLSGSQERKNMKYIFALLLTLASAGSALADQADTTVSTIPFGFVIGTTTFPAGTYSFSRAFDQQSGELLIRSKDGKTAAFFLPTTSQISDPDAKVKLQFRHEGDQYFLMGIVGALDTYTINSSRSHHKAVSPGDTVTATP